MIHGYFQLWNFSSRVQLDTSLVSYRIKHSKRNFISSRAPMYFSLCNFLRIPLTADFMLTIFCFCLCYLSPFKLLDILSEQFDMDICHICDYNWSGKFLIRFIHIGDYDIRIEMCNSHTLIQTFNLSSSSFRSTFWYSHES